VTINLDATLGENVAIAPQVVIYTGSHRVGPGSMRIGAGHASPVTIEDGAWVRLGAVLAPGVTIGRGSIVAAGAVVLKDVPANTYVEGNPAAVVRRLPWGDR
jgi:maltose O-acetyltransferase